jgi:hypothetical protein
VGLDRELLRETTADALDLIRFRSLHQVAVMEEKVDFSAIAEDDYSRHRSIALTARSGLESAQLNHDRSKDIGRATRAVESGISAQARQPDPPGAL